MIVAGIVYKSENLTEEDVKKKVLSSVDMYFVENLISLDIKKQDSENDIEWAWLLTAKEYDFSKKYHK